MTEIGGALDIRGTSPAGAGTVFKITPSGTLTTLYSFTGNTDGGCPMGGLIQATDGNFYGTTLQGGANAGSNGNGAGTIFKITPSGTLTTLYSFCSQSGCTDGEEPLAGLVQATDGNFYGTTYYGRGNAGVWGDSAGTIFKITPGGALTTLYSFCPQSGCPDGSNPIAGLAQATNGNLYGTAEYGGDTTGTCAVYGCGTVFSLSVGLGPFVETLPTSAKVGAAVKILGTNLTGATGVSFNGTPATSFKVVSSSEITTTVPAGATTGTVTVVAPGGTLSSNVPFDVQAVTATALTSSPNPSTYGQAVTFTAVVSSVAGTPQDGETISFMDGKTVLGSGTLSGGSATFTTSTLNVGTTSVTAVYGGDLNFQGSTSNKVKQKVNKAVD